MNVNVNVTVKPIPVNSEGPLMLFRVAKAYCAPLSYPRVRRSSGALVVS